MFLCQRGHSLEGLRSKFKGPWKCECRESGTEETFRIPICNGGSCVYCLNKALIWLSIQGTSLVFGREYCRWAVSLFAWVFVCLFVCFLPKELKAIKQGQQFFLHNLIWPVKIYSSKLYWKNVFSSLFCPRLTIQRNSGQEFPELWT